jgi:short-subunit dehydrogenase/uncharacterized membrane protein
VNNKGKFAIVTGASTGIGYELAKCCAADGFDLLVAADEPKISEAAEDFKKYGVSVEAVDADLATLEGVDRLYAAANGRAVDALLANAGHGLGGAFLDQDFTSVRHVVDTNVTGTIYLAQKVGADMRARGSGKILFTGSIAGFTPGTFNAVYNGTKAFVDSFSFALRNELKDSGVTVTCLMPGATETEFFERANMLDTNIGQSKKDDPADVAAAGYQAMLSGAGDVVTGWKNKLLSTAALIMPSEVLAEQHRKKAEPGSGSRRGRRETQLQRLGPNGEAMPSRPASLYTNAARHPVLTGGLVLAGAALAYAAAKALSTQNKSAENYEDVARDVHIETSITINKSPAELYAFWRDFKNLPLFMKNLESVTELDRYRSHWTARAIGGARVEWDAEIYNEKENELIAWRSLENADVVNAGSVRFEQAPEGHGTNVRVTVNYNPPAGKIGATVAQILGSEPSQLINEDLRRLKQKMETGEIATAERQASGLTAAKSEPATKSKAAGE